MKTILALVTCLALTGCVTVQKTPLATQRIADHVAYDVASSILAKHPEWRTEMNQAVLDLTALENQPVFDTLAVVEIIQRLPVEELQSANARILIDGGTLVIELAGDPALKPSNQESLRSIVRGLCIGLQRRLLEPDALHRLRSVRVSNLPPVPKSQ